MWKVGHSLIKAKMKEENAALAGEMSGHMFFAHRWFGFDDAIYAGARLVELLSRSNATLAELVRHAAGPAQHARDPHDLPRRREVRGGSPRGRAGSASATRSSTSTASGCCSRTGPGWGLVRASNTGPGAGAAVRGGHARAAGRDSGPGRRAAGGDHARRRRSPSGPRVTLATPNMGLSSGARRATGRPPLGPAAKV